MTGRDYNVIIGQKNGGHYLRCAIAASFYCSSGINSFI